MPRPNVQFPDDMNHEHPHDEILNVLLVENVKLRNEVVDIALEIETLRETRKLPRLR